MKIGDRVHVSTDDQFDGLEGIVWGEDAAGNILVDFSTDETGPDPYGPWLFLPIEIGPV